MNTVTFHRRVPDAGLPDSYVFSEVLELLEKEDGTYELGTNEPLPEEPLSASVFKLHIT